MNGFGPLLVIKGEGVAATFRCTDSMIVGSVVCGSVFVCLFLAFSTDDEVDFFVWFGLLKPYIKKSSSVYIQSSQ